MNETEKLFEEAKRKLNMWILFGVRDNTWISKEEADEWLKARQNDPWRRICKNTIEHAMVNKI